MQSFAGPRLRFEIPATATAMDVDRLSEVDMLVNSVSFETSSSHAEIEKQSLLLFFG